MMISLLLLRDAFPDAGVTVVPFERTLSKKKNWLEPELVSNSERASAIVPYALNGSAGCSLNRPLSSSVSSYT